MFASFMATINYMKENENLTRQKKVLPMFIGEVRDACTTFVDNSKELRFWNGAGIKYNFC